MDQKGFLKDDQIYFFQFWKSRNVWYFNLYVTSETNPMVWSKLLMNIILSVRNTLHGSGRFPEAWTDLRLLIFELKRSVIYKFVCTLWDKSIFELQRSVIYQFLWTLWFKSNGWSKSLMDIIFGIRKILHWSGRVPKRWPDLILKVF